MIHLLRLLAAVVFAAAFATVAWASAPDSGPVGQLAASRSFSLAQTAAPSPASPGTATPSTPAVTTPASPPAPGTAPPAGGASEPGSGDDGVEDLTEPDPNAPADGEDPYIDDLSIGEIPIIETVELTPDLAKRAIDGFLLVREKYKDAELENYENLQDFVDQNPQGKAFEADIKTFGFANVSDWNLAITTVGFTYTNIIDDQSEDIRQQIAEIQADTELAQDMKDRMIASLNAMIPSENNRKVVEDLMKDAVYAEHLKLLENEEE